MARKDKSIEDLDAEIARLEAELKALEEGGTAKLKEAEAARPPEKERKLPRVPLPFGRKKRESPSEESEATIVDAGEAKPAKGLLGKLPVKGLKGLTKGFPHPAAKKSEPAPPAPQIEWSQEGKVWRRTAAGEPLYLKRRIEGGEVREEPASAREVAGVPPLSPGLFGRPADTGGEPKQSKVLLLVAVAIVAIVVIVGLLLATGVFERGGGGGGAGAPEVVLAALTGGALSGSELRAVAGAPVVLDASQTRDPAGGGVTFSWDFGDGRSGSGSQTNHTYARAGTYTLTVTAKGEKREGTATFTVTVIEIAPAFDILLNGSKVSDENPVFERDSFTLDAGASSVEGTAAFSWRIEGIAPRNTVAPPPAGRQTTASINGFGLYSVKLTITDASGLGAETRQNLLVHDRFSEPFVIANSTTAGVVDNHSLSLYNDPSIGPARIRIVLGFIPNVTVGGTPLVTPPGANPNNLTIRLLNAAGEVVAEDSGESAPKVLEVSAPAVTQSPRENWTVEVRRPQGGLEEQPYTLTWEIRYRAK